MGSKFNTKDFILLLLNAVNKKKINGKLCFQKEMFLVVKEICPDLEDDLNFEPYHYGPFSKKLAILLDQLERDSLISIDRFADTCNYSITSEGVKKVSELNVSPEIIEKISNLKIASNKLGYKGLLRYVYFNYPEYAEKSKIKNRVLGDN